MALNNLGLGLLLTAKDMASGAIARVRTEIGNLGTGSEEMSRRFDAAFADFTQGAMIMGAGIAALRKTWDVSKMAGEFEGAVAEVSTLIDESVFPMEKIRDLSLQMTETYGGEARDQAKALYQTISAGISDADKATELLATANQLAVGGVTNVTTAVDALTNVVNAYSSSGAQAADVSDAFFVAIRAGKTTAEELAHSIGRVAPTASALGIGFDELLGATAAITTQGIATAEATTGLKATLASIIRPTKDAEEEAARLGIRFDAAALRTKGFAGFLESITSAAGYNEDSLAKLFRSVEAFNTMQALTSNNSAKFNGILEQMDDRAGQTKAAFDRMASSPGFQWQLLSAKIKVVIIQIGAMLIPFFNRLTAIGVGMINAIRSGWMMLPGPVREFLSYLKPVLATLAPVMGMLLMVGGGIRMLIGLARMAGIAFKALGIAGKLASQTLKATLIGLLITGALLVIEHWEEVSTFFQDFADKAVDLWNRIVASWNAMWDTIISSVSEGVAGITMALGAIGDFFVKDIPAAAWEGANAIAGAFWGAVEKVGEFFGEDIPNAIRAAYAEIKDVVLGIPIIGDVLSFHGDVFNYLKGVVTSPAASFADPNFMAKRAAEVAAQRAAAVPAVTPITAGTSPAVALTETQARTAAATMPPQPTPAARPQPQTQNIHVAVQMDGETIARAVATQQRDLLAREFAPVGAE
jgi:TP901 family phage tail tape measure protein